MRFLQVLSLAIALLLSLSARDNDTAGYRLELLKDNVYRFGAGKYHAALMVTDAGIFVTDPINPTAASWLSGELTRRFDVPIRYMAYLEALYDAVLNGMLQGKSVEILQSEIKLPTYADLEHYEDWLPLNVSGVYRTLENMSYLRMRKDIGSDGKTK